MLVVHGLDASKEVTRLISAALADGGFEVYDIDLPGHGDSAAKFRTDLAQHAIHNAKAFLGEDTIVLGHSLGASLLLDLAATEPFSTMVLLAPPPISVGQIHADRVLIATGEMDIPRIREFLPIAADIGNPNTESWTLPWGGHSAPIFNPAFIGRVVQYLGGDSRKTRTTARLLLVAVMFVAAIGFGVLLVPGREVETISTPVATMLVRYVAASAVALLVLRFVNPLHWLQLFSTDYVIGFLLVAGLALIAGMGSGWRGPAKAVPYIRATAAALFVIAVPGLLVGSRVLHMSLSDGRWWRFPFITLAGLPLFISDEWMIRRIHPRWKSEALALLTRGLLLAFILTGVLTLNRENAFLVMIAPLMVIFWIMLWFATGVIHRHTQSPIAAALFAALVQGWAFAAWFITT